MLGQEVSKLFVTLTGNNTGFVSMMTGSIALATKGAAAITAAAVGAGALAVREFAKFDQAMTESTSIMVGLTNQQREQMEELAKTLSMTGKGAQAPEELAKSYYFLASAGLDAEKSMAALGQVQAFATAGAFDMAQATDLLTDAQSALGMTSKDATENLRQMTRLSDVLVKANTLANASVEQFSQSLTAKAGSALKVYNKSVEEGVAVLAAYADQGVKANLSGENLNRVMLLLSKSAIDNAGAHKKYGFEVFDANGKMRNMADIMQNLEQITGNMSDKTRAATLSQLGFAARVQGAILPLLGSSQAIRNYQEQLENAGGITDDVANKQMASFSNQMAQMWNTIKVAGIEIGEVLAPVVAELGGELKNALSDVSGFAEGLKNGINFIRWFFTNWTKWIDYGVNFWILAMLGLWEDFKYLFTNQIPTVLSKIPTLFVNVFNAILEQGKLLGKSLLKGMLGMDVMGSVFAEFGGKFTEELMKVMDTGPERALSDAEKQQEQYLRVLGDDLGKSWDEIFNPKKGGSDKKSMDIFGMLTDKFNQAKDYVSNFFRIVRTESDQLKQYLGVNEAVRLGSSELAKLMSETELAKTPAAGQPRGTLVVGGTPITKETIQKGASKVWEGMLAGINKLVDINEAQANDRDPFADLDGADLASL